ncbi:MAG: ECF-type sigma factor [Gemmataceae bacterium]
MEDVTHILQAIDAGDRQAAARLLPLVYDERAAGRRPDGRREARPLARDATGLVHEAYQRLVGEQRFDSRGHLPSRPPPRPCAASSSRLPEGGPG